MEPGPPRAGGRLQPRPSRSALPARAGAQPDASCHLFAHATGGGVARDNQFKNRGRGASGGLLEPIRLLQCFYALLWLASLGIPAQAEMASGLSNVAVG